MLAVVCRKNYYLASSYFMHVAHQTVIIYSLVHCFVPKKTTHVARQDPRYRGPEEGKDAKRTDSIEACTAKMD